VRRDGMEHLKKLEHDHAMGKDDHHKLSDELQKLTDEFVKEVDAVLHAKDQEIMQV
jgi:ribosome recycling factor